MFVVLLAGLRRDGAARMRFDLTADRAHTLSPGTKRILSKLDSRVTVRFYCTQADNAMPPALRTYARRIEDLLREYNRRPKANSSLKKLDPKPDSDAEDSARLNGVAGQADWSVRRGQSLPGVVVSLLDEKFALPWLPPQRERLLEYDLSRALARVVNRSRPVIE